MAVLTIRIPDEEMAILKAYCDQTSRTQTDVMREFIRKLKNRIDSPSDK